MFDRIKSYLYLMRFHKPIGITLLLWPTLWGLWLANRGTPSSKLLIVFTLGVIVMRAAGCIINDIADRKIDPYVERTKMRPLAAGKISLTEAILLFVTLSFIALILALQLNYLSIKYAFFAMGITVLYPFLKRVTHLPQLGLGVAFSCGILLAFTASKNTIPNSAWVVFFSGIIWPIIYDTLYAMADKSDDIKIGVKSTAILFGDSINIIIAILQIAFITLLVLVGLDFALNKWFFLALILVTTSFIYQQILIHNSGTQLSLAAFNNNNWVGLFIFAGIILGLH